MVKKISVLSIVEHCPANVVVELLGQFDFWNRYSIGKPGSAQLRELRPSDFDPMEKYWTRFPPEGSKITPPHLSVEFRWKDYCPMVFRYIFVLFLTQRSLHFWVMKLLAWLLDRRHLRKLFSVDPADYMLAICGNDALRELSSPGKSGSFFFLTQDDRFMIKTVKKSEAKVRQAAPFSSFRYYLS